MKTPIAIALIIMGSLLVMTPPLSDYLCQRNLGALTEARHNHHWDQLWFTH